MNTITTIKGCRDLKNCTNRTPLARLQFFRALSVVYANGDWRTAREKMSEPEVSALSPGFNARHAGTKYETRKPVMYGFCGPQFRKEVWADECDDVLMNHRGWFTDEDCSRTLRAFVYYLPHGRFGCGYADDSTGQRVYLLGVYTTVRAAASDADHEAQHYAEEEQQYNIRWNKAHALRQDETDAQDRLRCYLNNRNDTRTAGRELARMELSNLRDIRKELADYADIEI